MATNKMEMKEISKHKTIWKVNPTNEPLLVTGAEVNPLKKFTIPKIRKTTDKVYLSSCYTNTREYSFIHDTLNQCRLDVSCDLQSSWQFGDTKLVHNEYLEKKFTSKRSEMRESGRHGRDLEEHFCFIALPRSDVAEIYHKGLSTKASPLKVLGNPLLGIYVFRHVDVALNYAHSRGTTVENIIIFKVLFGKVKKIQPSVDKNKVSLDPSPNFDCHMSRNTPSMKDTIELQAHGSAVYIYEYSVLSKPVDKPRQCLPYAILTVKYISQKVDNGHLMTSLKFLSTGFPKRSERTCSLNNCTVAKRIGKGKDATVIFEHFRKPADIFAQENCSCNTPPNSEINPSNSNITNSFRNIQNGNNSVLDTHNGQMEYNLAVCKDTSQVYTCDSGISFTPDDNKESVNGDLLLSVAYLRNILRSLSTVLPLQNNVGSSIVTTSKVIKDPRLKKRGENQEKVNVTSGSEVLPLEKSVEFVDSKLNLSSVPSDSAPSSEVMPSDHAIFSNCLDTPCLKFSFDASQSQAQDMYSKDHDSTTYNKITTTDQHKNSVPVCLSNKSSEAEEQSYSEEKAQRSQQRSSIPFLFEQDSDPYNKSVNTGTHGNNDPISQGSQFSHLQPMYQTDQQASAVFPHQIKESICEYVKNSEDMRNFAGPEDTFNHEEKQNLWKTKNSSADNYISLHQECKENMSFDSLGKICDHVVMTQKLEIPKSSTSTIMNNYEVSHPALELQNNLSPGVESLSHEHPQHPLLCQDDILTSFAISQKLMKLKLKKTNQNCISVVSDSFKEAKDILTNKSPIDKFISLHDIKQAHDNLDCNIAGEQVWVHTKNGNKPASLLNIQRTYKKTPQMSDRGQDYALFYNAQLDNNVHINTDFKEQINKENQHETKEETVLPSENNTKSIYEAEKQSFHTNNNFINEDERENNKNYNYVETLNSEDSSATLNLALEKNASTENKNLRSEYDIKQKETQNIGRSVEHLSSIFHRTSGSIGHVVSSAAIQITDTTLPELSTNSEDHQGYKLKETSGNSDLFIKHGASDCELNVDKNKLQNVFFQSISDNLILANFELENEIEVELKQHDDEYLFHQDTASHGNVPYEDLGALYKNLDSRIDWEGLLESKNGERDVLKSMKRKENGDQFYCEQSNYFCFSTQKNKELCNPILLPDLQVQIANTVMSRFSPTFKSLTLNDNFCKYITEATKTKINEDNEKIPEFEFHSSCSGGTSGDACEEEYGNIRLSSDLVNKSEISHSFDFSHKTYMTHTSEQQNNVPLLTEVASVTAINNEGTCSSTMSETDDTRNKKDTDSRIGKRKLHVSSKDQDIAEKNLRCEIGGKKRKLNIQNSSECFSSLSQGRIKIFSQSEKHIRSVLDILNSEVSLCKSKRLSRKLDKAVVHLKKAHKRVNTSLQLIAKVGETRKGPLPKSYAIICNNFWESCDLQGYSSMPERRYYSTKQLLSKRKYDKPGERRPLGFDGFKLITHVSKNKPYQTREERITKYLSKNSVTRSVSRNKTTIHVRGFCDQECPESQLTLCSTSQSTAQLSSNGSNLKSSRSSKLQPSPEKIQSSFSSAFPGEKLTEKENQHDINFLSNFSKDGHIESHSVCDTNDVTKENSSKASEEINDSVSLSSMKENKGNFSSDKDFDAICIGHTKLNTDVFISVLESNVEHFLNVDLYKPDNLILTDFQRNMEVNFPIKKWIGPVESSKRSITRGNFLTDPLNLTLITSKKYDNTPHLLPIAAVTDNDGKSSKSYLDKQEIFAVDSIITSTTVPSCQQGQGSKGSLKTELSSLSNRIYLDDNKTNVIENAKLACTLIAKESKSCGENIISNNRSLQLKNNIKDHVSQNCIKKKSEAVSLNNTAFNQLNKKKKETEVNNISKSESSLHSKITSNSKPDITEMNHVSDLHAYSETSKVTIPQKKFISHVNDLKEKHSSGDHSTLVSCLTQILRRADEVSSLKILQEQTQVCQNILPFFVKTFERMQECSLEQVLISRELLEQNRWNNFKYKLKPCAVDSLADLQMVMETIQFIENKKRLLGGEPTFRSLLWYDETLYSELLGRPRGFQQQSNFYPAFQGRLKYNAFCELQNYHSQLLDLFEETKRENKSYYTLLKYKRQIDECEAIMKHCSDCFDFCLSVPFTCGVNFGDNLGDLEALRKSTLKVISSYGDSPKNNVSPEKQDHLWIIIEMVSSKISFIKNNEAKSIKISLYGLEHIFFDAAKSLVWKEKRKIFSRIYTGKRKKEMLLKMNQNSFSKLKKIYATLSKDLNKFEQVSSNCFEESVMMTSKKSDNKINEVSIENCRLNRTMLSHPDFCYVSEIIDQAELADLKKLQELILKCDEHLNILKTYFQMQQEDNIDDVFITEENVLDMLKDQKPGTVILKPEAVETYIEIVMLSETVHFLKNTVAKKQDKQRFRGMLWFDLSLVPELIICQEKMTTFSFLRENATDCLEKVIETTISALNKELDIILKHHNAVNSSYALRLYSRELEELKEIKKLRKMSLYSVTTFINFVPFIASINYGSTVTELEYNYNQFSTLLKNVKTAHKKDLGKMAHITKVMKTIEHMKIICAKNERLTISFILCQMIHNRKKTLQPMKKEKTNIPIKISKNIDKPSTCMMAPSISEYNIKNIPNSSKKRRLTVDKSEDSQEQKKNTAVFSCKKQKVDLEDVPNISREKTTLKLLRTVRSHLENKNEAEPSSSDNLRRELVSSRKIEMQRSVPSSFSPLENLRDICASKSEDKIDLTNISTDTSEDLTGQHGDNMKEIDMILATTKANTKKDHSSFTVCNQKSVHDTFSKDPEKTSHKTFKNFSDPWEKSSPSDVKSETGASCLPDLSAVSKPGLRFVKDIHAGLEIDDAVCELPDKDIVNSSVKNLTCTSSSEPIFIQNKNPVLQINETEQGEPESKKKYMDDMLNPNTRPIGASGNVTLNMNQTAQYSLSSQQINENSNIPSQDPTTFWNDLPQPSRPPAYYSSESSFGISYPYYTWCVYHCSSINGNSITQTYQGITSYEVQPPPAVLTSGASAQNTRTDLAYSQYFSHVPVESQTNDFVPVNGYVQSQVPVYHFQQPFFSQYNFHQPLSQASYSYPPNSSLLPECPWIYAPWQQESFQPGH